VLARVKLLARVQEEVPLVPLLVLVPAPLAAQLQEPSQKGAERGPISQV
jgi:hypothetical protein